MERFNLPYIHLHSNIKAASLKSKRVFTCCFLGIDLFLQPGSVSRKIPLLPRGLWSENRPVTSSSFAVLFTAQAGLLLLGAAARISAKLTALLGSPGFCFGDWKYSVVCPLLAVLCLFFFFFPFSKYYCILSYLNKLIYYCCFVWNSIDFKTE